MTMGEPQEEAAAALRAAASEAHARRIPNAGIGGGCGGCGAGSVHPLGERTAHGGAGAGSVLAAHCHAPLPRSAEIGSACARNLHRPRLPDPVVEEDQVEDVTLPLMLVLERLSPLERAAFLLHDVFGLEFDEVAAAIDRDEAACRQLAHRARDHVRTARPRFKVEKRRGLALAEAFFSASRSGDVKALGDLLTADVSLHADGGGKRPAATEPIFGFDAVHALLKRLAPLLASTLVRVGFVNGLPGFVSIEADGEVQTTALEIEEGKIAAIYVVRNPDKLKHLHG